MNRKRGLYSILGLFVLFLPLVAAPYLYISGSRSFQEIDIQLDGELQIKGYLSEGTSPEGPWVILAHGNRKEGQAHKLYQFIANNMPAGVTVLAIDFKGFGKSSAAAGIAPERVLNQDEDLEAAIGYLKKYYEADDNQIVLIGHSMGSYLVLKAARDHAYGLVIPIGLGDYNHLLSNPQEFERYIQKLKTFTGVRVDRVSLQTELSGLTPQALFSPCPQTPVALIFGAYEDVETLFATYQALPESCRESTNWIKIPFSNHMYWTESSGRFLDVGPVGSLFSLTLLKWRLIHLLDTLNSEPD